MFFQKRFTKTNGCVVIDGFLRENHSFFRSRIQRSMKIKSQTAAGSFEFLHGSLFNPAVERKALVCRVGRVGKIDLVFWFLVFLKLPVLLQE